MRRQLTGLSVALALLFASPAAATHGDLEPDSAATFNTVLAFEVDGIGDVEVVGVAVEFFGEPGRGEVFLDFQVVAEAESEFCNLGGPGDLSIGRGPKARFVADGTLTGTCFAPTGEEVEIPAIVEVSWFFPHAEHWTTWQPRADFPCVSHSWMSTDESSIRSEATLVLDGQTVAAGMPGAGEEVAVEARFCGGPAS